MSFAIVSVRWANAYKYPLEIFIFKVKNKDIRAIHEIYSYVTLTNFIPLLLNFKRMYYLSFADTFQPVFTK